MNMLASWLVRQGPVVRRVENLSSGKIPFQWIKFARCPIKTQTIFCPLNRELSRWTKLSTLRSTGCRARAVIERPSFLVFVVQELENH